MRKRLICSLLSVLQLGQPLLAYAQTATTTSSSYTVQVPVTTVPFTPSKTTYDFGNVIVGQRPQHLFTFVNKGSSALTVTSVTSFSNAAVVTDNCTGKTLQGGEACTVVGAINVAQAASVTGELRVSHTANTTPDVFALKAVGVAAGGVISATQPSIDFGDTSINQSVGPKNITFKNTGNTVVTILDLSLAEGSSNFTLNIDNCITTLNPNDSCTMTASFKPQALGLLQGRIVGLLDDGSEVSLANLSGNGVQGTPTWTSTQVNFLDGAVGTKSANQAVTLTNTGKGPLNITSTAITGDTTFKLESSTCSSVLQPSASCTFQVSNTPPDTNIHSGYLELQTTNSSLKSARIQLYSRPMLQKAVLSVDPVTVDFGDLGVGATKTMNVTLKSTGNIKANVSKYALGGTNASAFSILNAAQCTGALAPNNQCVLQIQAKPTAVGAQTGTVTLTTDTPDPVPVLQLKTNGLGPSVSADKVTLSFGSVSQGDIPTLSAVFSNTGGAAAKLNSISTPQGVAVFTNTRDTTGACVVGGTLAAGATCKLNVSFLTAGLTGAQAASFVMNFDSGAVTVGATGSVTPPPLPTASLSTFTCPTSVTVNTPFVCTGTFTNTGTSAIALAATNPLTLTNTSFGTGLAAPSSNCPTEAAGGLGAGKSCTVTINGRATTASTWQTGVTAAFKRVGTFTAAALTQNSGTANANASTGAQAVAPVAALTDFSCNVTRAQLGVPYTCTATLSSTGNTPLTIGATAFTLNAGTRNTGTVTSDCPASLAVGSTCKVTLQGSLSVVGSNTTTVTVSTNAPAVSKSVSFAGSYASLALTTTNHPTSQYGDTTTATQTLTNQGSWPVTLTKPASISGLGLSVTGTTCGTTLAAGSSCTITTSCTPSASTTTGTLTAYPSIASTLPVTGNVGCTGTAPSLRLESATGQLTTNAGAYSSSGNWLRVVNAGAGKVTLNSITIGSPASTTTSGNFALFYDGTKADNCAPGKVIAANSSCVFLLSGNLPPAQNPTVLLQVNSTASPIAMQQGIGPSSGVSVVATKPFASTEMTGTSDTAEFTVTNLANWTLSGMTAKVTTAGTAEAGKGYTITGNTCTTLAPAGQAGSSCKITVTVASPVAPVASLAMTLAVSGGYPQVLNGVSSASVTSGVQGSATAAVAVAAPKLTFTPGTYTPIGVGQTATTTSTLRNDSAVALTFVGNPSFDVAYQSVVSSTCSGVFQPGQTCQIVTKFSPTAANQTGGTLTVNTNAGPATTKLVGQYFPQSDVSVRVTSDVATTLPAGSNNWVITVGNSTAGTASTTVNWNATASGGASVATSGVATCAPSSGSATCAISGKMATLSLPAGTSVTITQPMTYGANVGTVALTATSQSANITDTNAANDTATGNLTVAYLSAGGDGNPTGYATFNYGAGAIRADGSLAVVGYNSSGWLGTGADPVYKNFGTSANKGFITSTSANSGIAAVVGRELVAGIIKSDGSAWLAGNGVNGNFGFPVTNAFTYTKVFDGAAQIIPDTLNTVVLKKDGTVWVAGSNAAGQMGFGDKTSRSGFVKVFSGAKQVATANAGRTIFALRPDGTLWAVGDNSLCQMGTGNTGAKATFTQIATGVVSVGGGLGHSAILRSDGVMLTAGNNSHAQLGTGNYATACTYSPVLYNVASISVGYNQTAAVGTDGYLYMAGANDRGQLGSASIRMSGWGKYTSLGPVASVVTGYSNTIVQKMDGTLWGTGYFSHPNEQGLKYTNFAKLNP